MRLVRLGAALFSRPHHSPHTRRVYMLNEAGIHATVTISLAESRHTKVTEHSRQDQCAQGSLATSGGRHI